MGYEASNATATGIALCLPCGCLQVKLVEPKKNGATGERLDDIADHLDSYRDALKEQLGL